ncbi:MAG: hypothetical protein EA359_09790 [Balneolaceae bacterium]|nr:MAG: hypothetical protein EA359_09790 [Balneolaceae bacterium]
MQPTLFDFDTGNFLLNVTSYRFFGVLAAIYFLFFTVRILHQNGLSTTAKFTSSVMVALSFLIGSRILYSILFFEQVLGDPQLLYSLQLINFSLFGGLALALFSWWLVTKWYQLPFLKLTDKLVPHAAVSLIFFRMGCFLNGCCFGKTTDLPWGVTFPRGSLSHKVQLTPNPFSFFSSPKAVHPTQIYEILGVLIALFFAWFFWKKYKISGLMVTLFILLFTTGRIFIHFFRYYPESVVWSQTLQAPIMYGVIITSFMILALLLFRKHYQLKL